MGKLQSRLIKYQAPPANQIKVECTGRVSVAVSDATKVLFHGLKALEKILRANTFLQFYPDHSVHEIRRARRAVHRRAAEQR